MFGIMWENTNSAPGTEYLPYLLCRDRSFVAWHCACCYDYYSLNQTIGTRRVQEQL